MMDRISWDGWYPAVSLLLGTFAIIALLARNPTWIDVIAALTILFLGVGALHYNPGSDDE
jgi:hypothetical protein